MNIHFKDIELFERLKSATIAKVRVGDYVKYNWKAKAYIRSVYDRESEIRKIAKITPYSDGTEHCEFVPLKENEWGSGCDTFWLRKCYWWERPHNGI